MNLGFSQTWPEAMQMADSKTYFIEKIHQGILENGFEEPIDYVEYREDHREKLKGNWDVPANSHKAKIHTIRRDEHDRWKAGKNIHFAINSRSKNRFQFAPVLQCVSAQKIEIRYLSIEPFGILKPMVWINGYLFYDHDMGIDKGMLTLAQNDGFESVEDFFRYFNEDFLGKLIHWTNCKY